MKTLLFITILASPLFYANGNQIETVENTENVNAICAKISDVDENMLTFEDECREKGDETYKQQREEGKSRREAAEAANAVEDACRGTQQFTCTAEHFAAD